MTQIESEEEDDDIISDITLEKKKQGKRYQERRIAVCGEIYGDGQKNMEFEPNVIKKKTFTKNRILFRLKSAFIFNDLDENDINLLINAMEEVDVEKGK